MNLTEGRLKINVPTADGQNKAVWLELIEVKVAAEELERKHRKGDEIDPVPFCRDLAVAYQGLGVEGCSPSMAFILWEHVNKSWAELKKNIVASQS